MFLYQLQISLLIRMVFKIPQNKKILLNAESLVLNWEKFKVKKKNK